MNFFLNAKCLTIKIIVPDVTLFAPSKSVSGSASLRPCAAPRAVHSNGMRLGCSPDGQLFWCATVRPSGAASLPPLGPRGCTSAPPRRCPNGALYGKRVWAQGVRLSSPRQRGQRGPGGTSQRPCAQLSPECDTVASASLPLISEGRAGRDSIAKCEMGRWAGEWIEGGGLGAMGAGPGNCTNRRFLVKNVNVNGGKSEKKKGCLRWDGFCLRGIYVYMYMYIF